MTILRTARDWKVPPTTMLLGGVPGAWSEKDVLLANALTVLENEMCQQCGVPAWWGYSTDNRIQFKVEESTCYGCAELEKSRSKRSRENTQASGESLYVVPFNVFTDQPLPTRRESYERRK